MSFINHLIELDKELLLSLNSHFSVYWDFFFWTFTSKEVWLPLYLTLAFIIFKNHGLKGFITLLAMGLLIALCDRVASGFFKEFFQRYRPSQDPDLKYLVHLVAGYRGGMYGFVSSHAANTFGLAMFTSLIFRNKAYTWSIFIWAAINSYSRIYIGVHYPGDIIGGALIGLISGQLVYELYLRVLPRFMVISHHNKRLLKAGIAESFNSDARLAYYCLIIMTITMLLIPKVMMKII